jgi:hypothetical protein
MRNKQTASTTTQDAAARIQQPLWQDVELIGLFISLLPCVYKNVSRRPLS